MSKEDVINYVMTTPNNPNKAVLSGMLDSIVDASQGSGVSIPTVVQNTGGGGSTWITEEEANKVFGIAPLAFDLNPVVDGEGTTSRVTFFRNTYDAENTNGDLQYSGKVEGVDALWAFSFEQHIGVAYTSQGQVIQQITLEWNATSRRYEALVSA